MNKNEIMSKTKIVCTIGPASESKEMLTKLVSWNECHEIKLFSWNS